MCDFNEVVSMCTSDEKTCTSKGFLQCEVSCGREQFEIQTINFQFRMSCSEVHYY